MMARGAKTVNVRIRYGGQIMAYDCESLNPALGDWVVVRHQDLTYLGQVVSAPVIWRQPGPEADNPPANAPPTDVALSDAAPADEPAAASQSAAPRTDRRPAKSGGPALTDGRRMLRLATPADLARQAEHEVREKEAFEYCLSRVTVQRLQMKLVAVEVVFDGSKTIFYYTADERVDFRLLVKELVSRFRTRIEMRQIGVRHEARMVGGLGGCGRGFCCCGFLANFAPVSVKMAKEQNVSLSPAKISGACGRLMCCLAFEHTAPSGKAEGRRALADDPTDEDLAPEDLLNADAPRPAAVGESGHD